MNILAVGAHADDIEIGCGGSLARFRDEGNRIYIYTATCNGGSDPFGRAIRNGEESRADGEKAAEMLGAELIIGHLETNLVEFTDDLSAELIKIIDEKKIECMFTHWIDDAHHDHRNLARASIHAGRHLNKILSYRSNWYQSSAAFNPSFYIDISDYWLAKERLMNCYESEMKRTEGKWIHYNKNIAENYGMIIGTEYAEAFECITWVA